MKSIRLFCTVVVVALLCCFLLSSEANAQEPEKEWAYGLHMVSLHKPGHGMRTITPGAYAVHSSGYTVGAYSNSEGRFSAYTGWTFGNKLQLTLGAVTGYSMAKVVPMVAPSYKFDNGLRVSLIPNPWGQSAIHFSKEFQFYRP